MNKKYTLILLSVVLLMLIIGSIVVVFIVFEKNKYFEKNNNSQTREKTQKEIEAPDNDDLIADIIDTYQVENDEINIEDINNIVEISIGEEEPGLESQEKKVLGVVVATGTSIINIETKKVIAEGALEADNSAEAGSASAPAQSVALENIDILPESVIKMELNFQGELSIEKIAVNSGQAISLALTNNYRKPVVFRFLDDDLRAIAMGLAPQETRAITFNAPNKKGEYFYYIDKYGKVLDDGVLDVQ